MGRRIEALLIVGVLALAACASDANRVPVPGVEGALKSAAGVRAERRAYDGAPPVAAHEDFGIECESCHNIEGMEVSEVGYAPPYPHEKTLGMSGTIRCRQCHVFVLTDGLFVANSFAGLPQDLRRGKRLNDLSPPTIPHKTFMRENCSGCHSGPAAREEIRTSHPERTRCRQCHVEVQTTAAFPSASASASASGPDPG